MISEPHKSQPSGSQKAASHKNSPRDHSKWELWRQKKLATRQFFHPASRTVKNRRSNRLSNTTSGINLQTAGDSVRRTDFFWVGSCSIQLATLLLKAVDTVTVNIHVYHTSEEKRGTIFCPNREKISFINDRAAVLHPKAATYQQVGISHSESYFRQCSAMLGQRRNIKFPSSTAKVSTTTPLCGIRHGL